MTGVPAVPSLRPPSQVVLWDFDGTLAHRTDRWRGALLTALGRVDPDHGVILEDLSERFTTTYQIAGVSDEIARRATAGVRAAFLDLSAWAVFDDVRPALAELASAGWRHVILSNHVPELPSWRPHSGSTI